MNSASPMVGKESVNVTFLVAGAEQYKIRLTNPINIDIARRLLNGDEAPSIPIGVVVHGNPGVNTGYSWHIDPESVEFAETAMEVCDGLPSDVEQGNITSEYYCPWSAEVIDIDE